MIKSKRTFGVEMECSAGNSGNVGKLRKKLGSTWRFEDDGSIRDIVPFPTEVVSPILRGAEGEKKLREACTAMKEMGFDANHLACGMHVHLGAEDYKQKDTLIVLTKAQFDTFVKSTENVKDIKSIMYVNEDFLKNFLRLRGRPLTKRYKDFFVNQIHYGTGEIGKNERGRYYARISTEKIVGNKHKIILYGFVDKKTFEEKRDFNKDRLKEVEARLSEIRDAQPIREDVIETSTAYRKWESEYLSLSLELEKIRQGNSKVFIDSITKGEGRYVLNVVDRGCTNKLINLLLFYLVFDDVFLSMLPCSRRDGNSYCMPLSTSFSREEVLKCRAQDDFEKLWYKDNSVDRIYHHKRDHYDNSRYHNVNFHSLFNRHGTVEIRSHGATINPNKILLWTALHQHVLDTISAGVSREELSSIPDGISREKLTYRMFDILNLPDYLQKYVIRLMSFYSEVSF